ncbi:MAG: CotH kinase family protein [Flavobacteriales bacterium]|nr:CotH kinase family protein [Flavobacteriales bacterium]
MRRIYIAIVAVGIVFSACKKESAITPGGNLTDWTDATHGVNASPNYSLIFNDNAVQRFDIVIDADYWAVMQSDLESIVGSTGGGPGSFSDENPIYIPCQFYHNGTQWYDVGIRYKGNSSLNSAYQQGNGKLPFRLEFNHFEDENPEIWGQAFHGFQQLSLSSSYNDKSLIREKVTADIFRDFGVPAPRTSFVRVYIDFGDGATYFGLYTIVEVIFDTMIETQFTSGGTCYKPDGDGARLNDLSSISTDDISVKSGDDTDLTELKNMVEKLIDGSRTSNPSQWRSELEEVLDINEYLKYLAANQVIANWDTYGLMTHNYYLYTNPTDGKVNWIPWDNNEALTTTGPQNPLDFDFGNLSNTNPGSGGVHTWPMLYNIYNDATYKGMYNGYIDDFLAGAGSISAMNSRVIDAHSLVEQYVTGPDGEQNGYTFLTNSSDFTTAHNDVLTHISSQWSAADAYTP